MNTQVVVRIEEDGAGAERLAELAGALRSELLGLEVDDVRPLAGGAPPTGARGVDAESAGSLLASVSGSIGALAPLLSAVRSWVGRGRAAACTVEVRVGEDSLRLTGATAAQQDRLIDAFVRTVAAR